MNNQSNQPIFILQQGTQRTQGRNAQHMNILAAKAVADTIRTTLGPKGMDKMIVDSLGDIIITNDGVTILEEMHIEHPAAKMLVEVAKTQEEEIGDGTTTAVIIAGELLRKAEDLLNQEVHPTVLAKGYRLACDHAQEILNRISEPITFEDTTLLTNIAETAITGKGAESAKGKLSALAVNAVRRVIQKTANGYVYDKDAIKMETQVGGSVSETTLIDGLVIDKEVVHPQMPKRIADARVALLDIPVEIRDTEIDAKIQITDPAQMQSFIDQEERMLRSLVDKIVASGATVVFCQKGIDDVAQYFLAKKGVLAVRRVKKSDMEALARATGARIVTNVEDLSASDLGQAGSVEEKKYGDDYLTYITGCPNAKSLTVLVRGSTEHVVAEVKRAMTDAVGDVATALKMGKVVAGAAASEIEVGKELRRYAQTLSGREQLAVNAFAESMDVIAKTLAENAGLDPIDVLTELKAAHENHNTWAGINVFTGKVVDAWKEGVIEPLRTKIQALSSASEVAQMILRIDDVIAGGPEQQQNTAPEPGKMPPGM